MDNNENNNENNNSLLDMFGTGEKKTPEEKQEPLVTMTKEETPVVNEPIMPEVDNKPVPDEILQEPKKTDNNISDKELLKLYIGPNADKILAGGPSLPTFLFGMYYLFYRKMYQQVFILFILQLISNIAETFTPGSANIISTVMGSAILFYGIYLTIKFKGDYVAKAETTIRQIKDNYKTEEEIIDAVKKAGGVDRKFWILIVIIIFVSTMLSFGKVMKTTLNTNSSDVEIHFPEEFKPFQNEAARNQTSYQVGKYTYTSLVFNYRTTDNVCTFRILYNNEYNTKELDLKEIGQKYMDDKHSIKNDLDKKEIKDKEYLYYHDERAQEDTYLLITNESLTELNVTYIQDKNKKCHGFTNYILENTTIDK